MHDDSSTKLGFAIPGWRVIRSDAGRFWASRMEPFPEETDWYVPPFRTVDGDTFDALRAEVVVQEEAAERIAAASTGPTETTETAALVRVAGRGAEREHPGRKRGMIPAPREAVPRRNTRSSASPPAPERAPQPVPPRRQEAQRAALEAAFPAWRIVCVSHLAIPLWFALYREPLTPQQEADGFRPTILRDSAEALRAELARRCRIRHPPAL